MNDFFGKMFGGGYEPQMSDVFRNRLNTLLSPYGLNAPAMSDNVFLPETGFFGRHPLATRAIENALIGAATTEGGNTVGESISNIARSVLGIPRVRGQMQLGRLLAPLGIAQQLQGFEGTSADIAYKRAQAKESEAQGRYYDYQATHPTYTHAGTDVHGNASYVDPRNPMAPPIIVPNVGVDVYDRPDRYGTDVQNQLFIMAGEKDEKTGQPKYPGLDPKNPTPEALKIADDIAYQRRATLSGLMAGNRQYMTGDVPENVRMLYNAQLGAANRELQLQQAEVASIQKSLRSKNVLEANAARAQITPALEALDKLNQAYASFPGAFRTNPNLTWESHKSGAKNPMGPAF